MRILICDDDNIIQEKIHGLVESYFKCFKLPACTICTYSSGEDLLNDTRDMDIVFLDIEMLGVNGIYVGNELKKRNSNIIIIVITAYAEYLDDAMRFHVFRYLSKPIDQQRFFRNLKDAIAEYHSKNTTILIEEKTQTHTISSNDILCIEALNKQIIIHTLARDYYSIHKMDYWIEHLSSHCFFQSHRSFLVNLGQVANFDHTTIFFYHSNVSAYLTRRKYTDFKKALLLFLGGKVI